jgi:hypothetical protein
MFLKSCCKQGSIFFSILCINIGSVINRNPGGIYMSVMGCIMQTLALALTFSPDTLALWELETLPHSSKSITSSTLTTRPNAIGTIGAGRSFQGVP